MCTHRLREGDINETKANIGGHTPTEAIEIQNSHKKRVKAEMYALKSRDPQKYQQLVALGVLDDRDIESYDSSLDATTRRKLARQ